MFTNFPFPKRLDAFSESLEFPDWFTGRTTNISHEANDPELGHSCAVSSPSVSSSDSSSSDSSSCSCETSSESAEDEISQYPQSYTEKNVSSLSSSWAPRSLEEDLLPRPAVLPSPSHNLLSLKMDQLKGAAMDALCIPPDAIQVKELSKTSSIKVNSKTIRKSSPPGLIKLQKVPSIEKEPTKTRRRAAPIKKRVAAKKATCKPQVIKIKHRRGKQRQNDLEFFQQKFSQLEEFRSGLNSAEERGLSMKERASLRNRMTSLSSRVRLKILMLQFIRQTCGKDNKMAQIVHSLQNILTPKELGDVLPEIAKSWAAIDLHHSQALPLQITSEGMVFNKKKPVSKDSTGLLKAKGKSAKKQLDHLVSSSFNTPQALIEFCRPNDAAEAS